MDFKNQLEYASLYHSWHSQKWTIIRKKKEYVIVPQKYPTVQFLSYSMHHWRFQCKIMKEETQLQLY